MALQHQSPSDNEKAVKTFGPLVYAIVIALLVIYLLASNVKLNQRVAELEQRVARQGRGMGAGGMGGWPRRRGMPGAPGAIGTPMPGMPNPPPASP